MLSFIRCRRLHTLRQRVTIDYNTDTRPSIGHEHHRDTLNEKSLRTNNLIHIVQSSILLPVGSLPLG